MTVFVAFIPVINGWETERFIGVYESKGQAERGIAKQGYDADAVDELCIKIEEVKFFNMEEV